MWISLHMNLFKNSKRWRSINLLTQNLPTTFRQKSRQYLLVMGIIYRRRAKKFRTVGGKTSRICLIITVVFVRSQTDWAHSHSRSPSYSKTKCLKCYLTCPRKKKCRQMSLVKQWRNLASPLIFCSPVYRQTGRNLTRRQLVSSESAGER